MAGYRIYIKLLLICALSCSFFVAGCRQRRAIEVPEGVSERTEEDKDNMRVLIAQTGDCKVNFDGSFQAVGDNGSVQTFVSRTVGFRVGLREGSVIINNIPFGSSVELIRPGGEYFEFEGKRYRGAVAFYYDGRERLNVVNILPIEFYLAGVIAAEMPASWEIEALKAQAVAARTYSLYVKFTSGRNRVWDVRSTQADQVYDGIEAENPRIWSVIEQTTGKILTSSDSTHPYGIIPAYFSSTCGGATVNAAKVFGADLSPLRGVKCPYCEKTAPKKYYRWDEVIISKDEIFSKLRRRYNNLDKLGSLKTVKAKEYVQKGDFYKILKVELIGTNGKTDWLNADDFRFILGASKIKSTACRISDTGGAIKFYAGKGYGHNIGLCQYGAQAMARQGSDSEEILDFYYPGAVVKELY